MHSVKSSIFQMSQENCYYFKIFGYLPSEICSDSNEKESQKRKGFLRPISQKITLAKEKGKEDRKSEKKERRRREKSNGCTLNFYILG